MTFDIWLFNCLHFWINGRFLKFRTLILDTFFVVISFLICAFCSVNTKIMGETNNSLDINASQTSIKTCSLGLQELAISSELLKERTELYKKQGKHSVYYFLHVVTFCKTKSHFRWSPWISVSKVKKTRFTSPCKLVKKIIRDPTQHHWKYHFTWTDYFGSGWET